MAEIRDYFRCDECGNRDFKLVYNFSLRFHGVNFSDNLIYDRITEEIFICTKCKKAFTKTDIDAGLVELKQNRKKNQN